MTRKEISITFSKAMRVPAFIHESRMWTITTTTKSETTEIKFLRSVAGYTRKDKLRNPNIREGLNIYDMNTKITKSRSQWNYHMQRMKDGF